MKDEKHQFAFYFSALDFAQSNSIVRADITLLHRLKKVLRLPVGAKVILFADNYYTHARIITFEKKEVVFALEQLHRINPLKPFITLVLPFLKPAAFEEVLYTSVELGVSAIQLLITEKAPTKRAITDRQINILRAAAEQSKNFSIPSIQAPQSFEQFIVERKNKQEQLIFFDPAGDLLWSVATIVRSKIKENITLIVGPEGDLTQVEKKQLLDIGTVFCALTPTVLRSTQAVAIGVGAFRSLLRSE